MTNHEKYFGTPERASKTRVTYYGDPERIDVEHKGRIVASNIPKNRYKKWLESEATDE